VDDVVAHGAHGGDDVAGRGVDGSRVERRLRVLLEQELDGLCGAIIGDLGGEHERHVQAGGHAGAGEVLAVAYDALRHWWPPFCLAVDFTVAAIVATQLLLGANFQS
jgi:hypothetical protein